MAWIEIKWRCGHTGEKHLYGTRNSLKGIVARESSQICLVCWLLNEWRENADPRAERDDAIKLAKSIAEGTKKLRFVDGIFDNLKKANA